MSTVPKKNDIIINPTTQRPIRVGGRSWLKLVKEGVLSGHYQDPKNLGEIGENPEQQIEEINKTLPKGKQAVRGRGRYKGQITTRNVKPNTEDVIRSTTETACRVLDDNLDELVESDNISEELERLILQEMAIAKTNNTKKSSKTVGRPKKEQKYSLEESPQYDEYDDDEDDDDDIDYFLDE